MSPSINSTTDCLRLRGELGDWARLAVSDVPPMSSAIRKTTLAVALRTTFPNLKGCRSRTGDWNRLYVHNHVHDFVALVSSFFSISATPTLRRVCRR